jgi:hypothetical protein
MKDFWISCGHHLLDRNDGGGLVVTDEFLKAYFVRPELAPPPEACMVERVLHGALLAEPRKPVSREEVAMIADPDARENWQFVLAFRDILLGYPTLEAAYLALMRSGSVKLPPLFVNQLTHVILRNALDGCDDPFVLRAGELFFRVQRVTLHEQSLICADEEKVAGTASTPLSPLVSMLGIPAEANIDVMTEETAPTYWERSDLFDMAFDLTAGRRGMKAFAEVMTRWINHLMGVNVKIEPLTELRDAKFSWYVGLDSDATRIGDKLWNGELLDEASAGRVAGLFRLMLPGNSLVADEMKGEPAYLLLAMTPDRLLRVKPQNLLIGLPVRNMELAS